MKKIDRLSWREQEVVELILNGCGNKQIASALNISDRTVEFHLTNIYSKLEVKSRVELILLLGISTGRGNQTELGDSTVEMTVDNNQDKVQHQPIIQTESVGTIRHTDDGRWKKGTRKLKQVFRMIAVLVFSGFFWTAVFSIFLGKAIP